MKRKKTLPRRREDAKKSFFAPSRLCGKINPRLNIFVMESANDVYLLNFIRVIQAVMSGTYRNLIKDSGGVKDLAADIVSNNIRVFTGLTQLMIFHSAVFQNVEATAGSQAAREALTDMLVIFRRQVKFRKIALEVIREKILANKTDLLQYLDQLLLLVSDIRLYNQTFRQPREFEMKLINGKGYQQILRLKSPIINALAGFGCKNADDREEIFNECLVVFWQKLMNGQIGLFFRGKEDQADKYQVYNRKFYQNSKLSTFLTGIAKNIFLNRLKSGKSQPESSAEMEDAGLADPGISASENTLFFMFLYYRIFVETRKLRVVISLLQYDCGLEDSEVKQLTGLNNARFHNSRLRGNFHEWYEKHLDHIHHFYDKAAAYLGERELKLEKLNRKILHIEQFRRNRYLPFVPEFFREEFRTSGEFNRFHPVFRYIFYLASAGKTSSLAGLPDESRLREMMTIYRESLLGLAEHQAMIFLLFYGTEEPENTIVGLLKTVCEESSRNEPGADSFPQLAAFRVDYRPVDPADLSDKLFATNHALFNHFMHHEDFLKLIQHHESAQRVI